LNQFGVWKNLQMIYLLLQNKFIYFNDFIH
jgi:hypothetical protein